MGPEGSISLHKQKAIAWAFGHNVKKRSAVKHPWLVKHDANTPMQILSLPPVTYPWDAEHQAHHENGLCFHCNEKFAPSHRYKSSSLALMKLAKDREAVEDLDEPNPNVAGEDLAKTFFHTILEKTLGTTMKL